MNLLQIEVERAGNDLPVAIIQVGDHTKVNLEVLRPRWARWHWWLDKHRHTTEHTIMSPVLSVKLTHWGVDRGAKTLPSTFVVPKAAAARLRRMFKASEDEFGAADIETIAARPWRGFDVDEMRSTMYFPDEYKTTPDSP